MTIRREELLECIRLYEENELKKSKAPKGCDFEGGHKGGTAKHSGIAGSHKEKTAAHKHK